MDYEFGIFEDLIGLLPEAGSREEIEIEAYSDFFRNVGYQYETMHLKKLIKLFQNEFTNSPHAVIITISNYETLIHIRKMEDISFLKYLKTLYIMAISNKTMKYSDLEHLFEFMRIEECLVSKTVIESVSYLLNIYANNDDESTFDILINNLDMVSSICNNPDYREYHAPIYRSVQKILDKVK